MFTINQKGGILANLMHLLIDTWNVLHQTGILPPENAGIGIKGLTRLVATSRLQGCLMTLVCDGTNVKEGVSSLAVLVDDPRLVGWGDYLRFHTPPKPEGDEDPEGDPPTYVPVEEPSDKAAEKPAGRKKRRIA